MSAVVTIPVSTLGESGVKGEPNGGLDEGQLCTFGFSLVCSAVEPVLSEPGPVAAVLRELRLRELHREHTGGHKHSVASVLRRPLPASSTSTYHGPSSAPTGSCGAGGQVIPGLPPSSPLPPF